MINPPREIPVAMDTASRGYKRSTSVPLINQRLQRGEHKYYNNRWESSLILMWTNNQMIEKCLRPQRRFPIASTATGATDTPDNLIKVLESRQIFMTFLYRVFILHGLLTVLFYDRDKLSFSARQGGPGQWPPTPPTSARPRPSGCQPAPTPGSRWWGNLWKYFLSSDRKPLKESAR